MRRALLPPVVLLGPPGVGKSTVGPLLAQRLGLRFIDLDERADVAAYDGSAASEIAFRVRECLALRAALDEGGVVIAAGAGVVDVLDNRTMLRDRALCLGLDADPLVCVMRLGAEGRPWLNDHRDTLVAYQRREHGRPAHRQQLVASTANANNPPDIVADDIARAALFAHRCVLRSRLRLVEDTIVARTLDVTGDEIRSFVIADDAIAATLPRVDLVVSLTPADKRLSHVDALLAELSRRGVRRSDTIVAVGGGLLLDVVGLAAALHHRGTPWRAVPTTLLAMVDASIGGKTAVDVDGVRNSAGVIHQPISSHVWLGFLDTLDGNARRHGRAEMLKHALLIGCDDLHAAIAVDASAIRLSRAYKRTVVQHDVNERHLRYALNLGHTFAHGIESVCGLAHGDAVLHGLRAALWLSQRVCHLDENEAVKALAAIDSLAPPPLSLDAHQRTAIVSAVARDKKPGFVLLGALGEPWLVDRADIDDALINEACGAL